MPSPFSSIWNPSNSREILCLVVCNAVGTEIPYPSSHTETAMGALITAAALMASQNTPSDVLASPMVTKQTSFPSWLICICLPRSACLRYQVDAWAIPTARAIWPPVEERSADMLYRSSCDNHLPCLSMSGDAKWQFI